MERLRNWTSETKIMYTTNQETLANHTTYLRIHDKTIRDALKHTLDRPSRRATASKLSQQFGLDEICGGCGLNAPILYAEGI